MVQGVLIVEFYEVKYCCIVRELYRFVHLWCAFVCVTYTAECIGERAGGQDCADRI